MKNLFILLFTLISFTVLANDSTVVQTDTSKIAVTVDELITKYGPQIQERAQTLWQFLITTGEKATTIIYKYLMFKNIFWLFISILGLIGSYYLFKFFIKLHKEDEYAGFNTGAYILGGLGYLTSCIFLLTSLYDTLELLIVPELVIIKYIMHLVNGGC